MAILLATLASVPVYAQSASNGCGTTNTSHQYMVNTNGDCNGQDFDLSSGWGSSAGYPSCNGTNTDDGFGWFVATAAITTVEYDPTFFYDAVLQVFDGCGGSVLGCSDSGNNGDIESVTIATVPGDTYVVRVMRSGSNGAMSGTLCIHSEPEPPANDDPCGAIALTVGSSCSYASFSNDNASNSPGIPSPGCASYSGDDVWFTAVVPASGHLLLDTDDGNIDDGGMAAYSASSCAGPFTLLGCDDDDSDNGYMPYLDLDDLVPGTTVYIRFWSYDNDEEGSFSVCAMSGPMALPTVGDCSYSLDLYDSYGNGWGNSSVDITIDGVDYGGRTTDDSHTQVQFAMNSGQELVLTYNNSGNGQNQNSFELTRSGEDCPLFSSGSSPSTTPHSFTGCLHQPNPPQDCAGALTVCGNETYANSGTTIGCSSDLNGENEGCMDGEHQGTWFFFSPASGGTLGLTITPTNTDDDYDFAVWGPFTNVQCPFGPPVRCSYAGGTSTTGIGNGANDASESAGGNGWVKALNVTTAKVYVMYIDNYSTSGQDFSLTWQLSAGAMMDCTVLPVELVDLRAVAHTSTVDILWSTASESNSDRFIVERSADNEDFTPLGTVTAAGNSQYRIDYRFTDGFPLIGANYYRLNQVDKDGASVTTSTVVAFADDGGRRTRLFPNPVKDVLQVAFDAPADGEAVLAVRDALGRVIVQRTVPVLHGARTEPLSVDGLQAGYYTLRITLPTGHILEGGGFLKQ
jgi:hypothetical protein